MKVDNKKLKNINPVPISTGQTLTVGITRLEQPGLYELTLYEPKPIKIDRKMLRQLETKPISTKQTVKVDLNRLAKLGLYQMADKEQKRRPWSERFVKLAEFFENPAYRKQIFIAASFAVVIIASCTIYSLSRDNGTYTASNAADNKILVTYLNDEEIKEYIQGYTMDHKQKTLVHEPDIPAEETSDRLEIELEDDKEQSMLVMTNVQSMLNVRAEPSSDSEKAGVLYSNCGGTILEQEDGWTKLKSGDLVGWVNNDMLLFNEKAQEKAKEVGSLVATIDAPMLNIRKGPSTDDTILALASEGDEFTVIDVDENNWAKIEYKDNATAYISAKYAGVELKVPTGETVETIKAREAEKKAKEEKKKEELVKVKDSRIVETYAMEMPETEQTEEAAQLTADTKIPTDSVSGYGQSDINMLAAIIYCEAGDQPYEGKVGVGNVVMNRLNNDKFAYATTIEEVIRHPGQFSPVKSGKFDRVYRSDSWSDSCYQAALDVLNGTNTVGDALYFKNPKKAGAHAGLIIGNHVFW